MTVKPVLPLTTSIPSSDITVSVPKPLSLASVVILHVSCTFSKYLCTNSIFLAPINSINCSLSRLSDPSIFRVSFSIFLGSHGLLSRTDYLTVSTTNSVFRLFEGGKVLLRYFLLWGFSSAVSRHLSLDTGNSFGLKYTAESEFRRFLLKL